VGWLREGVGGRGANDPNIVLLGYEAGHLLKGQRILKTKEVTRRGLFLAS
jgi:hypothetical protein